VLLVMPAAAATTLVIYPCREIAPAVSPGVVYGFRDDTDIPAALALAAREGLECELDLEGASYFMSRVTLRRSPSRDMSGWRKALFLALARNAADPVEYFRLPYDRTVVMGRRITI